MCLMILWLAWSSSSSRSTKKRTRWALPERRKRLTTAAAVRVLSVPVDFEEKAVLAFLDGLLEAVDGLELIRAEEPQLVGLDIGRPLCASFFHPASD